MPDLPSRRSARPTGSRPITQGLTSTIRALLIANAVLFGVFILVRPLRTAMISHLAVGPRLFVGEVWQPITALFVHFEIWSFIFTMIGIWWVGASFERTQGTRRFLGVYLTAGVLANLAFGLVAHLGYVQAGGIFAGGSLAVLALFVAFGRIFGRTPMPIIGGLTLQARTIAMIYVAWSVVVCLSGAETAVPELAATAVSTAVGYFGAAPGGFDGLRDALKLRRLRRRYRVIEGGAGRPPKNFMN